MKNNGKSSLQETLYEFPYHYLAWLDEGKVFRLHRQLGWGLDYMTYMTSVVEVIRLGRPQSLLDVGCGDGRLLHMVGSLVPHLSGVDLSERAIAFARAFNPQVEFACADIATISHQYDWLTLIEVLEHIPDEEMEEFVRNLARLVKRDGRLLISVPTINVPLTKKHFRHYDLDSLKAALNPCFEIEKHWWLYRRGAVERCLRAILCNRFCVLNFPPLLAWAWRAHQRMTYCGGPSTAAHLLCVARLGQR